MPIPNPNVVGVWSGSNEPTAPGQIAPGQLWIDLSGVPVLKVLVSTGPSVWKIVSTGVAAKTVSVDYTVNTQDFMVIALTPLNFHLPTAAGLNGTLFRFKNDSNGAVTVLPFGSETINGEVSQSLLVGSVIDVVSDGTTWHIV